MTLPPTQVLRALPPAAPKGSILVSGQPGPGQGWSGRMEEAAAGSQELKERETMATVVCKKQEERRDVTLPRKRRGAWPAEKHPPFLPVYSRWCRNEKRHSLMWGSPKHHQAQAGCHASRDVHSWLGPASTCLGSDSWLGDDAPTATSTHFHS